MVDERAAMKAPLHFVYGNCLFADGFDDAWAAFAVEPTSYQWLGADGKRARFLALLGAIEAVEADVQVLRVGRMWDVERYARELHRELSTTRSSAAPQLTPASHRYLEEHRARLTGLSLSTPAIFVIASLREPERDVASYVSNAAARHPRDCGRR